jgi:hypothetical protein
MLGEINSAISAFVWGAPMLAVFLGTGFFLSAKTRFFQIFGIKKWFGTTLFAVADKENLLIPEDNWQISPLPQYALEEWDARVLLRLAMMTLFSAAVNSDSFRYILTIAQALTGCENAEALNTLPYPYNPGLEELS